MKLYWYPVDWDIRALPPGTRYSLREQMHTPMHTFKGYTHAWVTKIKDGRWDCQLFNTNGIRTFRTCKQAKAYAVAIITLSK